MSKPILSICIPTYNRPKRISSLLDQILSFKGSNIEVVVGDDNPSSALTNEIIRRDADPRLKYFRNKKNLGMDGNMLKTIIRSSGEFVFILMDDDDIDMESVSWLLNFIGKNKTLTHIFGVIGDKRPGMEQAYFKCVYTKYNDRIIKGTLRSLIELIFHYHHASGVILRKNALDIKACIKYCGFLWIQQALIAQTLVKGDAYCSSRVFSYIGSESYESGHPRINPMIPIKTRIQIITEITENLKHRDIVRKKLINRQKSFILWYLNYFNSLKNYIDAASVLMTVKTLSTSISFWVFFLINTIAKSFKRYKIVGWFVEIFNKFYLMS